MTKSGQNQDGVLIFDQNQKGGGKSMFGQIRRKIVCVILSSRKWVLRCKHVLIKDVTLKQQYIWSILWVSKYGGISTLLRLPLSDFKLQSSYTDMLSKELEAWYN